MDIANSGVVLDASVIVAMIQKEPIEQQAQEILLSPLSLYIGSPTLFETRMVLLSRGASETFDSWWSTMNIEVLSFTATHANIALQAFERFGKGRHPAKLNFGDCMAYATAKLARVPLLHVGDDFKLTDLVVIQV